MNLSEEEYSQCGEYLLCFVLCKPLVFVDKADINTLIDQRKLQKIESLKYMHPRTHPVKQDLISYIRHAKKRNLVSTQRSTKS